MQSQAGRIVVGYDGSARAAAALDWAAAEAERRRLPLTVLHVIDFHTAIPGPEGVCPWPVALNEEAPTSVAEAGADRARHRAGSVQVTALAHLGQVVLTLIDAARTAELVVVGTRDHGAVLGSVSSAVSSHARCPVTVVRGDSSRLPGPRHPVVVGADGSPCSDVAVRWAADIASATNAGLVVVAAYQPSLVEDFAGIVAAVGSSGGRPAPATMARDAAQDTLGSAVRIAADQHPELQITARVLEGPAAGVLAQAAFNAGMLVVGSRGRGGVAELLLGSVSHGAVHLAPCPVTVVKPRS